MTSLFLSMTSPPEFEHGRAALTAANALILSAMRQLNDTRRKKESDISAVSPCFALEFPNKIIDDVERGRLTRFYNLLKTPRLPKAALRRLIDRIEFDPVRASACAPCQFEEWRKLIYRFALAESIQLQGWIPVMNAPSERPIRTPVHLAQSRWSDVIDLAATFPAAQPAPLLWQAAAIQTGGPKPTPADDRSMISPAHLSSSFRGERLNQTTVAKARESSMTTLGLSAEFDGLGHAAKIRKLDETAPCSCNDDGVS